MAQPKVELSRDMSLFDITMIGVGAMIGAGIFVLTGIAAGEAGPALILSFALNGVITVFTAMVYAELGSAIPEAGGGYLWVKEGLPGPNAFLSGWMSWFAHAVAGSLYALGFGGYMGLFFSEVGVSLGIEPAMMSKGFAVLIIVLFVLINFRGASETGTVGNIVTVLKIIVLLIFIASGLLTILDHPVYMDKFDDFAPHGFVGVLGAMGLTFIAFEGYEIIVQAGEEVVNPRRNIPKAIFLSLAIVVPIYIAVAFVSLGAPETAWIEGYPPTYEWLARHEEVGIAEAARQFMPLGTLLILIGGLLSTMSALNATTYSSTRVSFAMGRDKGLPDAFAQVHPKTRTPYKALLFTGVLITFMALAIPIEDVAAAADIMFLLLFLQVNIAIITIREKFGQKLSYGYLTPFFPIVPIIGIVTKFFLAIFLFNVSPIAWIFALIWMVVGLGIFYVYARPRQNGDSRSRIISQTALITGPEQAPFHILVPIAHPASLSALVPPAIAAARKNGGMITLLHVITVAEQTPLSAGRQFIERSQPLTDKALAMIPDDVSAEVVIRLAHRSAQAIIDTAREIRADLVIMGWHGGSKDPHKVIGRNIDQIYDNLNCNVLTIRPSQYGKAQKVLVPLYDINQLGYAVQVAATLTPDPSTQLDVLHVFSPEMAPDTETEIKRKFNVGINTLVNHPPEGTGKITFQPVTADDAVQTIVDTAADYDYVVIGATRDSWLKQRFFGSKPARIAQNSVTPVVLIRPRTDAVRFGLHQILNYVRGGYGEVTPESEQRLKEHGILDPESAPNAHELHSSVSTTALLIIGFFTLIVIGMMYLGGGDTLTWIGTVAFVILLWIFTWVSIRAPDPEQAS